MKIYNSKTRQKETITPQKGNKLSLYTCGPTVYNYAHIGNFRTYIFEDIFRRVLNYFAFDVHHVMNLTDVDDKTIKGALKEKQPLDTYTQKYKQSFFNDIKTLNIQPAHHYPAATDYIPQMIQLIEILLDKKIAYQGNDKSVYFAIKQFENYGALAHLAPDSLQAGASERINTDEYDKDHVSDFVLWKAHDPKRDEHIYWESPFGKGRPGWHIECSAMAMSLLGETIDIHCGAVDNIFPHHENEIAQSEACTQKQFVRYWVHSEHLIVDGKKMAKSLNNFYTLRDLLDKNYSGRQIRYMLLQTHYRTQLNFTLTALEGAASSLDRIDDCIFRLQHITQENGSDAVPQLIEKTKQLFEQALADDLNISVALAALFDTIREIHTLCDQNKLSSHNAQSLTHMFEKFDQVLGVIFSKKEETIPQDLQKALKERIQARQDKDWGLADSLRQQIENAGYIIEDSSSGSRLKKR